MFTELEFAGQSILCNRSTDNGGASNVGVNSWPVAIYLSMQLSMNVSISVYTSLSSICDVSLSTAVEVLLPLVQLIFSFMLAVLALGDSDLMTRIRDRDAGSHSQYEFDIVPPACPRLLGPGPGPPTGGLRQAGSLQVEGRAQVIIFNHSLPCACQWTG